MTALLDKAYETAQRRPETEQNILASRWLDELESDCRWEHQFAESEDALAALAAEALAEDDQGRTRPLILEQP